MINLDKPNKQGNVPSQNESKSAHYGTKVAVLPHDDFERNVWCLAGIPADISTIDQAVAAIDHAVSESRRLSFVTPNVNWLTRATKDQDVRQELVNADLSLVDGAPLAALARHLGIPIKTRVAGSDLFDALRRRPPYVGKKLRVFFFGGRDGAAEAAANAVNSENGGVESVGWLNPGFGSVNDMSHPDIIANINKAAPDFILVALGAGKGQRWIEANQKSLDAPVLAHLGAVVDFTAGGITRAPKFIRRFGMEWAWRIKEEPSLWRRYMGDALALAGIFCSRILLQRQLPSESNSHVPPQVDLKKSENRHIIGLRGSFNYAGLAEVRSIFRRAATENGDVILDFTNLASFDRAFLGLVLMLEKHVALRGETLFIEGAKVRHLKVLKANDMRYPSYGSAQHNPWATNEHSSQPLKTGELG